MDQHNPVPTMLFLFFLKNKYLYVHRAQDSGFSCEHDTSSLVNKV